MAATPQHCKPMGKRKKKRRLVQAAAQHELGIAEASAVAALPNGRFLIADDEAGLFICAPGASPQKASKNIRGDLEGVCISDTGDTAYVLCERRGRVWRADIGSAGLVNEVELGRLPALGARNRGWEGICWAGPHWHSRPALLAAHQRSPALLGVFELPSLRQVARYALPKHKAVRKNLADLNDLTVDPANGNVLVLSGRCGAIVTFAREGKLLKWVSSRRIATAKDNVPEGLTFDASGNLWVVTDGKGQLRQLAPANEAGS